MKRAYDLWCGLAATLCLGGSAMWILSIGPWWILRVAAFIGIVTLAVDLVAGRIEKRTTNSPKGE